MVSEMFFEELEKRLGNKNTLTGYYGTFNNCREQGLMLNIYDKDRSLCIWACECRNSDDIMIVLGSEENKDNNNMFDDEAYKRAKYFKYSDYDSAVSFVFKQIKYMFKDKLSIDRHFKFDCNYNVDTIQRIKVDEESLDYDDYYELASFCDENENYSCDLIIYNGAMGLRYNYVDKGELENLTFEKCNINLENEITIMLDMKTKLEDFIERELEHSIETDTNIKI